MADVTVHNLKCLPALHMDGVFVFPSSIAADVVGSVILALVITRAGVDTAVGLAISVVVDDNAVTFELIDEYASLY